MAESNLHKLSKRGQSVWIDSLSRTMLESGELARLMKEDAVVGVTTNPTIFQKAISQGDAYDEQLKELLESETDPKEIFLQLSARDVEAALDAALDRDDAVLDADIEQSRIQPQHAKQHVVPDGLRKLVVGADERPHEVGA